jgi:hypothetical protein
MFLIYFFVFMLKNVVVENWILGGLLFLVYFNMLSFFIIKSKIELCSQ